jgi:hypothetical protein
MSSTANERGAASRSPPFPKLAGLMLVALTLSACAAGSDASHHAASAGMVSQLFLGLWHGIIAPVALLVEVVNVLSPHTLPWQMRLYEPSGTGVAYDVGFYFGILGGPGMILGGWSRRR